MIKLFNEADNMFRQLEAMFNYPLSCNNTKSRGLRGILNRPHNLMTRKDNNGNITGYAIECVYTPFSKNDVKITIENNILTVRCGKENKVRGDDMDYCGVSYQSYEFSIPLSETVDINKIEAKAEDGMLRIELPNKEVAKDTGKIEIKVK